MKAKQLLDTVNSGIIQFKQFVKVPTVARFISQQEFRAIVNPDTSFKKTVGTATGNISVAGELLESKSFNICVPIVIQDQLNGYAFLAHYHTGEIVNQSWGNIAWALHQLPPWSLVVKLPYSNNTHNVSNIKAFLQGLRSDIIDIEEVKIPDVEHYFDVLYDPVSKMIFIQSLSYGDKVYMISWLDFDVHTKFPWYSNLQGYFAIDIRNIFFL